MTVSCLSHKVIKNTALFYAVPDRIFLCLISSLCLLLCAWFSLTNLIYCCAKYLHDHRWEGLFFVLISEVSVLPFPLPNPVKSSTHVYVEGFLFMLCCWCLKSFCQRLTRTFLLPKIPEPTLLMGKESFFFLSYVAKCIYHQCSQGILENTFSYSVRLPVAAFTLLFSEQSIWIGQSTLERSLQSLPMPTEEVIYIFQQMFLLY